MGTEGAGLGIEVGVGSKFKHDISYESPIKKGQDVKV